MNILEFWKSNPQYWITLKNRNEIDKLITDSYFDYYFNKENINWIERVIYLDQFSRHFQRHLRLNEDYVTQCRSTALEIVYKNEEYIADLDEVELIFILMPFKHFKYYFYVFDKIQNVWLQNKPSNVVKNYRYLSRFYYDSYKKVFDIDYISKNIKAKHTILDYDCKDICEYFSENYIKKQFDTQSLDLYPKLTVIDKPIISLSGGVDSMVLLYYYRLIGMSPKAVHIVYGNRAESEAEYNFLIQFCNNIGVELYTYRIQWIRRDTVDRDFYESVTRDIRFMVYRAVGGKDCNIILGHIRDDVVENIWTNIATCRHLDNLKRMSLCDRQKDVFIWRPFINISKEKILEIAHGIGIPYLKNTTPEWSNRGKYRNNFHSAIQEQYGTDVDERIIRFAEMVTSQQRIIDELLYKSILDSHLEGTFDITIAVSAEVNVAQWEQIFERIMHQIFKSNKCSTHSIRNFYERINKFINDTENTIKVQIKKNMQIEVFKRNNKYYMKFIVEKI
jgi:tRNA(Ile)-lysidine synthetase-like protein